MNSYEPGFLGEAAGRIRTADSRNIDFKSASAPRAIQGFSFGDDNKIKTIGTPDKYFLTISSQQFGIDGRCEPTEWLQ